MNDKERKEASLKRIELAKLTQNNYSWFKLGEKKAVTKVNPDPLSKEERRKVEEAKERINSRHCDDFDPFYP